MRRAVLLAAGVAVIGGLVVVLREPAADNATPEPEKPVAQTSVRRHAGEGVVLPDPGARPAAPVRLVINPGGDRLRVMWGQQETGTPEPAGATGYEVRWGARGQLGEPQLIAEPAIQLDGLEPGNTYNVEVRTVDAWGQRSEPAKAAGTPVPDPADSAPLSVLDRFDGPNAPDPRLWRFAHSQACASATPERGRLMISARCGPQSVALRSRTPFRLAHNENVLGRAVVETDAPGNSGELLFDFVPGPVDLTPTPAGPPAPSGPAGIDEQVPPGAIRVRVWTIPTGGPVTGDSPLGTPLTQVQVVTAPGTPAAGVPVTPHPVPLARTGLTIRWEVRLTREGVRVFRDGQLVGAGQVVPTWTEATALVGFVGPQGGQLRAAVDRAGFAGAPTETPQLVVPPALDLERRIGPFNPLPTPVDGPPMAGVRSGQLRLTVVPSTDVPAPVDRHALVVDVGGKVLPARPAVPGQVLARRVRYPVVVDLPPEAIVLGKERGELSVRVWNARDSTRLLADIEHASLELTGEPGAGAVPAPPTPPVPPPPPAVARPEPVLLDAAGMPVDPGRSVPPGRLLLDVTMDAAASRRAGAAVAGLAGIEVWLDGRHLAGLPTTADGPGVGGRWRIALNTVGLVPGPHSIEVRVISTDPNATRANRYVSLLLTP
ncbi:hypothetical protein EV193_101879 [Herbihabitans rhizosphaerae]|uniref:Fibronectin type-III domain-containing protein n=1 Tax=Herbihabitans rhizosphaerae TaxID=1872711 RepID=A0A4Q7L6L4_9PSEU|nr:hypothetical protein EV193_101879 [Herbihabitans rhizosphaerae]